MKPATFGLAAILAVGLSTACLAEDMVAAQQASGSKLGFLLKGKASNATLSIAGPNGFFASTFSKSGALAIDLSEQGPIDDGTYTYELTATSGKMVPARPSRLNNGRSGPARKEGPVAVTMSGTFRVKGGEIIKPDPNTTERKDR